MPIETPEEFEEWLEDQPKDVCSLIAARLALRALPTTTNQKSIDKGNRQLALNTIRLNAIAILAATTLNNGVRKTAVRLKDTYSTGGIISSHMRSAVAALRVVVDADAKLNATSAAFGAAQSIYSAVDSVNGNIDAAEDAEEATYTAAYEDAEIGLATLASVQLWHEGSKPGWWKAAALSPASLFGQERAWDFWREWYQGFLDGKPLDWELQRRVALIEDAIWKAGPEAVAAEIDRIRAEYLAEKVPQAERVEFNAETGKFFTVPIEIVKPNLLGATLTQVADTLEDVLASPSNGLHDNSREVRVLRRIATKYGNDPQQIEMGFVSVHASLTRQILNDELPPSEENLALQAAVEEGARAIRATHSEVAENRKILSEQLIRELPDGAKEKLEDALPILRAISDPELADDWDHDIHTLINDATTPLPSGAPALPGADETTRIFSRAAKISLHLKVADVIHKVDGSAGYKAARIVTTIAALVALGIAIF